MVERRKELDFRYTRKKKMKKLKAKLAAPGADREKILYKIKRLSPFWTEEAAATGKTAAMSKAPREARAEKSDEPKRKGPPRGAKKA
jgi:hypothetical protein